MSPSRDELSWSFYSDYKVKSPRNEGFQSLRTYIIYLKHHLYFKFTWVNFSYLFATLFISHRPHDIISIFRDFSA